MGKKIKLESVYELPEYTGIGNELEIEVNDGYEWFGHSHGTLVGRIYDDGEKQSYFKKDEGHNTAIFDNLRNDIDLIRKHQMFRKIDTLEAYGAVSYYIPYKVKGHSAYVPTVVNAYVDRCSNVEYAVEFEILLVADEEYRRYITVCFETVGSYASIFYDQIETLEETFEEWFEENKNGFTINEYAEKSVLFYDETGEPCDIEIESMRELLAMISSMRVIKCERKIIE